MTQYVLIPRTTDPNEALSQICSVNTLIDKLTKPTFFHREGIRRLQTVIDYEQIIGQKLDIEDKILNLENCELNGIKLLTYQKEIIFRKTTYRRCIAK